MLRSTAYVDGSRVGDDRARQPTRWPTVAPSTSATTTKHDAAYVALAESLDYPLLTADARLSRAPGIRCQVELLSI
jgi:hypothetical protein